MSEMPLKNYDNVHLKLAVVRNLSYEFSLTVHVCVQYYVRDASKIYEPKFFHCFDDNGTNAKYENSYLI